MKFDPRKKAAENTLKIMDTPQSVCIQGNEHKVVFKPKKNLVIKYVIKNKVYQPIINKKSKLDLKVSTHDEYISRIKLQNKIFGDNIDIIGKQKNEALIISQPLIIGTEPTEIEVSDWLKTIGCNRLPSNKELLPIKLSRTSWVNRELHLIIVDARTPNFKKDKDGIIYPIDLMLTNISQPKLDKWLKN